MIHRWPKIELLEGHVFNNMLRKCTECLILACYERGGQPVVSKDEEYMLVSSILKLSACAFGMDSHDIRKITFTVEE